MKQITAAEFKAKVELDPAWAATLTAPVEINLVWANMLTEPVEITDYCAPQPFLLHPNWPFGQSYGGAKNSPCVDSRITKIEDTKSCPS